MSNNTKHIKTATTSRMYHAYSDDACFCQQG